MFSTSILLMNLFPPCVFSVFAYLLDINLQDYLGMLQLNGQFVYTQNIQQIGKHRLLSIWIHNFQMYVRQTLRRKINKKTREIKISIIIYKKIFKILIQKTGEINIICFVHTTFETFPHHFGFVLFQIKLRTIIQNMARF